MRRQSVACSTADRMIQEGAYAAVTVKLGLIKLLTKTFDICEEAYVNYFHFPTSPALLLTMARVDN